MTTLLSFGKDQAGFNAFAPATSTDKWNATIADGTETSFTVPSNYQNWIAFFSFAPGSAIWVDLTGTAATPPGGATFSSCTSELNPGQRRVQAGGTISCYNNTGLDADVGVVLYAITD